jgi:hypothetical protein
MMRRRVAIVAALLLCTSLSAPAGGDAKRARLPIKTLFKFRSAHGYNVRLTAWLFRRERPYLQLTMYAPSGVSDSTHFAADSKHPFRLDSFAGADGCRDIGVGGSISPSVKRVVGVRQDATTFRIRRQRPPASWHYKGRLIGAFIGSGSRTVRLRLFGAHGRLIGTFAVLNDLGPTCSNPGH